MKRYGPLQGFSKPKISQSVFVCRRSALCILLAGAIALNAPLAVKGHSLEGVSTALRGRVSDKGLDIPCSVVLEEHEQPTKGTNGCDLLNTTLESAIDIRAAITNWKFFQVPVCIMITDSGSAPSLHICNATKLIDGLMKNLTASFSNGEEFCKTFSDMKGFDILLGTLNICNGDTSKPDATSLGTVISIIITEVRAMLENVESLELTYSDEKFTLNNISIGGTHVQFKKQTWDGLPGELISKIKGALPSLSEKLVLRIGEDPCSNENDSSGALDGIFGAFRLCRVTQRLVRLNGYNGPLCIPPRLKGLDPSISLRGTINISNRIERLSGAAEKKASKVREISKGDALVVPQITIPDATMPALISILPIQYVPSIHKALYDIVEKLFGEYLFKLVLQLHLTGFDKDNDIKGKIELLCKFTDLRKPPRGVKAFALPSVFFLLDAEKLFDFILSFSVEVGDYALTIIVKVEKRLDLGDALSWTQDLGVTIKDKTGEHNNSFTLFWEVESSSSRANIGMETEEYISSKPGIEGRILLDTKHLFWKILGNNEKPVQFQIEMKGAEEFSISQIGNWNDMLLIEGLHMHGAEGKLGFDEGKQLGFIALSCNARYKNEMNISVFFRYTKADWTTGCASPQVNSDGKKKVKKADVALGIFFKNPFSWKNILNIYVSVATMGKVKDPAKFLNALPDDLFQVSPIDDCDDVDDIDCYAYLMINRGSQTIQPSIGDLEIPKLMPGGKMKAKIEILGYVAEIEIVIQFNPCIINVIFGAMVDNDPDRYDAKLFANVSLDPIDMFGGAVQLCRAQGECDLGPLFIIDIEIMDVLNGERDTPNLKKLDIFFSGYVNIDPLGIAGEMKIVTLDEKYQMNISDASMFFGIGSSMELLQLEVYKNLSSATLKVESLSVLEVFTFNNIYAEISISQTSSQSAAFACSATFELKVLDYELVSGDVSIQATKTTTDVTLAAWGEVKFLESFTATFSARAHSDAYTAELEVDFQEADLAGIPAKLIEGACQLIIGDGCVLGICPCDFFSKVASKFTSILFRPIEALFKKVLPNLKVEISGTNDESSPTITIDLGEIWGVQIKFEKKDPTKFLQKALGSILGDLKKAMLSKAKETLGASITFVKKLFDNAKIAGKGVSIVAGAAGGAIDAAGALFEGKPVEALEKLGEAAITAVEDSFNLAKEFGQQAAEAAGEAVVYVAESAYKAAEEAAKFIEDVAEKAYEEAEKFAEEAAEFLIDTWDNFKESAVEFGSALFRGDIEGAVNAAWGFVKGLFGKKKRPRLPLIFPCFATTVDCKYYLDNLIQGDVVAQAGEAYKYYKEHVGDMSALNLGPDVEKGDKIRFFLHRESYLNTVPVVYRHLHLDGVAIHEPIFLNESTFKVYNKKEFDALDYAAARQYALTMAHILPYSSVCESGIGSEYDESPPNFCEKMGNIPDWEDKSDEETIRDALNSFRSVHDWEPNEDQWDVAYNDEGQDKANASNWFTWINLAHCFKSHEGPNQYRHEMSCNHHDVPMWDNDTLLGTLYKKSDSECTFKYKPRSDGTCNKGRKKLVTFPLYGHHTKWKYTAVPIFSTPRVRVKRPMAFPFCGDKPTIELKDPTSKVRRICENQPKPDISDMNFSKFSDVQLLLYWMGNNNEAETKDIEECEYYECLSKNIYSITNHLVVKLNGIICGQRDLNDEGEKTQAEMCPPNSANKNKFACDETTESCFYGNVYDMITGKQMNNADSALNFYQRDGDVMNKCSDEKEKCYKAKFDRNTIIENIEGIEIAPNNRFGIQYSEDYFNSDHARMICSCHGQSIRKDADEEWCIKNIETSFNKTRMQAFCSHVYPRNDARVKLREAFIAGKSMPEVELKDLPPRGVKMIQNAGKLRRWLRERECRNSTKCGNTNWEFDAFEHNYCKENIEWKSCFPNEVIFEEQKAYEEEFKTSISSPKCKAWTKENSFKIEDNVSWISEKHTFKSGNQSEFLYYQRGKKCIKRVAEPPNAAKKYSILTNTKYNYLFGLYKCEDETSSKARLKCMQLLPHIDYIVAPVFWEPSMKQTLSKLGEDPEIMENGMRSAGLAIIKSISDAWESIKQASYDLRHIVEPCVQGLAWRIEHAFSLSKINETTSMGLWEYYFKNKTICESNGDSLLCLRYLLMTGKRAAMLRYTGELRAIFISNVMLWTKMKGTGEDGEKLLWKKLVGNDTTTLSKESVVEAWNRSIAAGETCKTNPYLRNFLISYFDLLSNYLTILRDKDKHTLQNNLVENIMQENCSNYAFAARANDISYGNFSAFDTSGTNTDDEKSVMQAMERWSCNCSAEGAIAEAAKWNFTHNASQIVCNGNKDEDADARSQRIKKNHDIIAYMNMMAYQQHVTEKEELEPEEFVKYKCCAENFEAKPTLKMPMDKVQCAGNCSILHQNQSTGHFIALDKDDNCRCLSEHDTSICTSEEKEEKKCSDFRVYNVSSVFTRSFNFTLPTKVQGKVVYAPPPKPDGYDYAVYMRKHKCTPSDTECSGFETCNNECTQYFMRADNNDFKCCKSGETFTANASSTIYYAHQYKKSHKCLHPVDLGLPANASWSECRDQAKEHYACKGLFQFRKDSRCKCCREVNVTNYNGWNVFKDSTELGLVRPTESPTSRPTSAPTEYCVQLYGGNTPISDCNDDEKCAWMENGCAPDMCRNKKSEDSCTNNDFLVNTVCKWNNDTESCGTACKLEYNESDCEKKEACVWKNDTACTVRGCAMMMSSSDSYATECGGAGKSSSGDSSGSGSNNDMKDFSQSSQPTRAPTTVGDQMDDL